MSHRLDACRLAAVLACLAGLAGTSGAPILAQQGTRLSPDVYSRLPGVTSAPKAIASAPWPASGSAARLLRRLRIGWHPQVDRRHHLGPDLRRPAGALDWRYRRRAIGPSTVWVGTGEACIRSHISVGEGIYKSTDAGRTWARMGLEQTGRIGKVIVHPKNPTSCTCALGHAYGPQPERGVFRTTDGGKAGSVCSSWTRTLDARSSTWIRPIPGSSSRDVADRYQDLGPRERRAGQRTVHINDGGPRGRDCGDKGCHTRSRKVKVAIAPSNPDRVYAMIETGDGIPWKARKPTAARCGDRRMAAAPGAS